MVKYRHTGIVCGEISNMVEYYTKTFGLKVVSEGEVGTEEFKQISGFPVNKVAWVKLEEGVELLQYYPPLPIRMSMNHMAFTVDNIEDYTNTYLTTEDVKVAYIYDPEGNVIEVVEIL